MRDSEERPRRSSSVAQRFFTAGLAFLFLMVALVGGLLVFDQVRRFIAASDSVPPLDLTAESSSPDDVDRDPSDPVRPWQGTERVNVLVMGIDQRRHEEGPWRTDTMLMLTIDPVTMSAGVLSIPRDLWVPIPGYREGRINTAHYIGEIQDHPGGGPALAARTVQYNLGIPIDHYARVNFTAFERSVDLIGGIDVYVEKEIDDPTYPDEAHGYDPLYISAGEQHFDGEMALKYARTRHSPGGDFDRAKRQQKVLSAIFEKVTRPDMLPTLAPRAPQIWRTLKGSVVTDPDLTLRKIVALAKLASEVDPEAIRYGVIDEDYTQFWKTPDGQQVLIPLRGRIRELRDYVFATGAPSPEKESDPAARLEEEAVTIEVLNGTLTPSLAAGVTGRLRQEELRVVQTGNADRSDVAESLVIAHTDKAYTAEYIARLLNLPQSAVVHGSDPTAECDISVILGADYRSPGQ